MSHVHEQDNSSQSPSLGRARQAGKWSARGAGLRDQDGGCEQWWAPKPLCKVLAAWFRAQPVSYKRARGTWLGTKALDVKGISLALVTGYSACLLLWILGFSSSRPRAVARGRIL